MRKKKKKKSIKIISIIVGVRSHCDRNPTLNRYSIKCMCFYPPCNPEIKKKICFIYFVVLLIRFSIKVLSTERFIVVYGYKLNLPDI